MDLVRCSRCARTYCVADAAEVHLCPYCESKGNTLVDSKAATVFVFDHARENVCEYSYRYRGAN